FAFGGKLVSGLQNTFVDGFLDLLNDLLIQPRGPHDFVHDILPNRRKAPASWYDRRTSCNSIKQNRLTWGSRQLLVELLDQSTTRSLASATVQGASSIHTVLMFVNSRIP